MCYGFRINRLFSKPWQLFTFPLHPVWHCQALQLYQVCSNWLSTLIYSPRHGHCTVTALQFSLHSVVDMTIHYTTMHYTTMHPTALSGISAIFLLCTILSAKYYLVVLYCTLTLHYGATLLHYITAMHSYTTLRRCIALLHYITALNY